MLEEMEGWSAQLQRLPRANSTSTDTKAWKKAHAMSNEAAGEEKWIGILLEVYEELLDCAIETLPLRSENNGAMAVLFLLDCAIEAMETESDA